MKEDEELEMLLDEIPHATSLNLQHLLRQHNHQEHARGNGHGSSPTQTIHGMCGNDPSRHYKYMCASPASGVSLQSEGSSWSWLSGGHSSSDDGSPSQSPFNGTKFQTPIRNLHYSNGLQFESKLTDSPRNANENLMDELGLSGNLRRMHIRDELEDSSMTRRRFPTESYGFQFGDRSMVGTNYSNVEKHGPFEDFRKDFYGYEGLQSSVRRNPTSLNGERRCISTTRSDGLFSHPMSSPWRQTEEHASNCNHRGIQVPSVTPSICRPSTTDAFLYSQQNRMYSNGDWGVLNSQRTPQLTHLKLPLSEENVLQYSLPVFERRAQAPLNSGVPLSLLSMRSTRDFEASNCEDSFIIQGNGLNYVSNKGCDRSRGHKKGSCNESSMGNPRENSAELHGRSLSEEICKHGQSPRTYCPFLLLPKYNSLVEVQGYIYFIAKDQHGCRFLQRKFEEGTPQDVQLIFNEIIDHVVELMMNPFGNYLMQKLLDVCNEEQIMQILLMVTEEPGELVRISLNTHGTRVVQKLIENLKTRHQISLVISALELGFLDLIKDLNGNHVVQRCLQCLSSEDNKDLVRIDHKPYADAYDDANNPVDCLMHSCFCQNIFDLKCSPSLIHLFWQFIFDAAAKFCVDIATHKHGCCVLQQCIAHSAGKHRENLVAEISANGFLLAQDDFG
ncbi:hypothetical protein HHK36_009469 [Tetracentron sinense]|uniref:PUM-HD domain-containing protein n=1 Tax=Tetracentron sinense TaxID=13715 RepID=A0A835DL21_TETSI|nr:hypothetical protein HHK36_009469 [Tetracentron sinense]